MIPFLLSLVFTQMRSVDKLSDLQVTINVQRETVTIVVQPPADTRVR